MDAETYQLEVKMRIQKVGPHGEYLTYNGVFEMSEKVELGTIGFLELTKILGQFHDVAQEIQHRNASSGISQNGERNA